MTKITLNWEDWEKALTLARARFEHNIRNKVKDSIGGSNIMTHLKGILGDIAVGKALGLPINEKVTSKDGHSNRALIGADVGGKYEVRTTTYKTRKWPIYKWDFDKSQFIFVMLEKDLSATICGWMTGRQAKKYGDWGQIMKNKSPAFWIKCNHGKLKKIDKLS